MIGWKVATGVGAFLLVRCVPKGTNFASTCPDIALLFLTKNPSFTIGAAAGIYPPSGYEPVGVLTLDSS